MINWQQELAGYQLYQTLPGIRPPLVSCPLLQVEGRAGLNLIHHGAPEKQEAQKQEIERVMDGGSAADGPAVWSSGVCSCGWGTHLESWILNSRFAAYCRRRPDRAISCEAVHPGKNWNWRHPPAALQARVAAASPGALTSLNVLLTLGSLFWLPEPDAVENLASLDWKGMHDDRA